MAWQQYYNEGIEFKEAGEFEKSAESHLKVIELKPDINLPEAWHNAGAALLRVNKPAEAEPYLQKAAEMYDAAARALPEKQAYYLYWKAAVYALLKNKSAMLATLAACFEIDDSFVRETAFEEDFSHYSEDEDFKNLVEPVVKAIEILLFRGKTLSKFWKMTAGKKILFLPIYLKATYRAFLRRRAANFAKTMNFACAFRCISIQN